MDCRRIAAWTAVLVCVVGGCGEQLPVTPNGPAGNGAGGTVHNPPPPAPAPDPKSPEVREVVKQLNPDTLVAFGAFREQMANEWNLAPAEKERLLEEARGAYQRAIETDAKYVPGYTAMARLFDATGRHDRAMTFYEKALKVGGKDPALWSEVGMVYARNKQWEPALRTLKKAVELDPDRKASVRNYGMCLARAGKYDEAVATLRQCTTEAEARCIVARMLHHLGQDEASMQQVQLALRADPQLKSGQALLTELQGGAAHGATAGPITEPQPVTLTGGQ